MAVDIGQAVVSSLEAIGQLFVVKPKEVHPCGLEVVYMNRVFGHTKAQIIRFTVHMTTLHATSSHDHGVAIWKMITTQYFPF